MSVTPARTLKRRREGDEGGPVIRPAIPPRQSRRRRCQLTACFVVLPNLYRWSGRPGQVMAATAAWPGRRACCPGPPTPLRTCCGSS